MAIVKDADEKLLDAIDLEHAKDLQFAESKEFERPSLSNLKGPLARLIPVFLDLETLITSDIKLNKMTIREYAKAAPTESIALCIGATDTPDMFYSEDLPQLPEGCRRIDDRLKDVLRKLARSKDYVFVAYNAAFDIRILRFQWGMDHPENVWCALEGAMGAWPELPGGYKLDNCCRKLGLPRRYRKYPLNLEEFGKLRAKVLSKGPVKTSDIRDELRKQMAFIFKSKKMKMPSTISMVDIYWLYEQYNVNDVEALREIYYREVARTSVQEQEVGLHTQRQRRLVLEIDADRRDALIEQLNNNILVAIEKSKEHVSEEEADDIFNVEDDQSVRSVRVQRLRRIINLYRDDEEEFTTTSKKKLSVLQLAKNPKVAKILDATSKANKNLSHKRRSAVFRNVDRVDVELGYMRAGTGRFSSPSSCRGLNLHNCPKHAIEIAKPVRQMFRLPNDLCFVRVDLANAEYRMEGYLTDCTFVMDMFDPARGGDLFTDPYIRSWKEMVGVEVTKKDPARQISKSAVLGLGFCMGIAGYAQVLIDSVTKEYISFESISKLVADNLWMPPRSRSILDAVARRIPGCPIDIITCAYNVHTLFNRSHPEFRKTADWLVDTVSQVAQCAGGPEGRDDARWYIDKMYNSTRAPDRNKINLVIDNDPMCRYPTIRVQCGPWPETLCWREPHVRPTDFSRGAASNRLTVRKSHGYPRSFTRNLAIENVTQAAARNALCMGIERMEKFGYRDYFHVHDELLLVVPKVRAAVLKAREDIIKVFGPNHGMPYGWALLAKPGDVAVTQTLWEDEDDIKPSAGNRWGKIEAGDPDCFVDLP